MSRLKERADPIFLATLKSLDVEVLEHHPSSVYALTEYGELVYFNSAWERFAEQNNGAKILCQWPIGSNCYQCIPPPLQDFYFELYEDVLHQTRISRPRQFVYECSSPEKMRRYCMSIYALPEIRGLANVNTLVHVEPQKESAHPATSSNDYVDSQGLIHQCAHCRRIQMDPPEGMEWRWVSQWVAKMPENITHDLCPICYDYFYLAPLKRGKH